MQEVMEADPELPRVEPVTEKIGEKTRKAKKRGKLVTCMLCNGETLHEEWRVFGMRCSECRDCFVHSVCVKANKWTCDRCRVGGNVAE
jgi:hypothetical protein